jgi:hypothetical protein
MADEKDFAKELNALIKRYVDGGCDPQDIADELLREAPWVVILGALAPLC